MMITDPKNKNTVMESRPVTAGNGVVHLVTLETGWWECCDWMVEYHGESLEDIAAFCERFIKDHPGDDFATVFTLYLHCFMRDWRHAYHRLGNDNLPEQDRETGVKEN